MRPRMSDRLQRTLYIHGEHAQGSTLRALDEARSILAETEPSGLSAVDQDWPHRYAPHSAYYSALAESLRSFVEGN